MWLAFPGPASPEESFCNLMQLNLLEVKKRMVNRSEWIFPGRDLGPSDQRHFK